MIQKTKEEYYFLTEKLEEINWALEGKCNDIDCDKYLYKNLLKKRYKSFDIQRMWARCIS